MLNVFSISEIYVDLSSTDCSIRVYQSYQEGAHVTSANVVQCHSLFCLPHEIVS